jgi:hypothetical protein
MPTARIFLQLTPIGIGPYLPVGDEEHESRKAIRLAFGLDKDTFDDETKKPEPRRIRDLSKENLDVWTQHSCHQPQNGS